MPQGWALCPHLSLAALGLGGAKARPYNTYNIWTRIPGNTREFYFFGYRPLPRLFWICSFCWTYGRCVLDLRILNELRGDYAFEAERSNPLTGYNTITC